VTSNVVLCVFVAVFWLAVGFVVGKKVSLVPVVPLVPLAMVGLGLLLNAWIAWAGSIAVALLHVVPLAIVAVAKRRELFGGRKGEPDDPG